MKKFLIVGLILGAIGFQYRFQIMNTISPPESSVILYSYSWCPECAKAKKFFKENGIPFAEYDVEESEQAKREYEALGAGGIPMIWIDGETLNGFDPDWVTQQFYNTN